MESKKFSSVFVYNWSVKESDDNTLIKVFGITEDYKNVFIKIEDFTPYFYIELPTEIEWNEGRLNLLKDKLSALACKPEFKPIQYRLFHKRKLYFAHKKKEMKDGKYVDETYPFLLVSFCSTKARELFFFKLKNKISIGEIHNIKLGVYENEKISPILNLMALRRVPSCGWINVNGEELDQIEKESTFDIELSCSMYDIFPNNEKDTIMRPKTMTFDIEANSTNIESMPNSKDPRDKVFQISMVVFYKDILTKYIFSLGKLSGEIVGKDVIMKTFPDESSLLLGFTEFIRAEQICVINGYNTLGWDLKYMYERSVLLGCVEDFDMMGCISGVHAEQLTNSFSSKAHSSQSLFYLNADGRLFIDLLPIVKRDYKIVNYKLKTVTEYFKLKDPLTGKDIAKDPLSVKAIFRNFRRFTEKSLSEIAKYCVIDSYTTHLTSEKILVWMGLCEMAKVAHVPLFYLFTEGTQIQMYSQLLEYCVYNNYVIYKGKYVNKYQEYKGATVLNPIAGRYKEVDTLDFASLYPSIIMAYNIDFTTLIDEDDPESKIFPNEHCNVFDFQEHQSCIHDPDRKMKKDGTESKAKRKVICGKRYFRFLKKEYGGDGAIPLALMNLIDARKKTRDKIKLNDREILCLIHSLIGREKSEYFVQLKNQHPDWFSEVPKDFKLIENTNIARIQDLITANQSLDKRQASYKICANSMYGAMGVKTGRLPFVEAAMSVTYVGRKAIEKISTWIPETYGGITVYGDSITGDTPILLKYNENIMFKTLNEVSDNEWIKNSNKYSSTCWNKYLVWSSNGWSKIERIIKHRTNKRIFRVNTEHGLVDVTEDHSLLTEDCMKIKPKDCSIGYKIKHNYPDISVNESLILDSDPETLEEKKAYIHGFFYQHGTCERGSWVFCNENGDVIEKIISLLKQVYGDIYINISRVSRFYIVVCRDEFFINEYNQFYSCGSKKIPDYVLNSSARVKQYFMSGFLETIDKNLISIKKQIGACGVYYLMKSIGYNCSISYSDKSDSYILTTKQTHINENKIKYIDILPNEGEIDVFDITTDNHTFQAGIGEIIVHNTDSVMIYFPHLKNAKENIEIAEKITADINSRGFFPKPMKLEFEKLFKDYIIFSKKRYIGTIVNKKGEFVSFMKKGIVLARRDNCKILTNLYTLIVDKILSDVCSREILDCIVSFINDMFSMKFSFKDFVVTKALTKTSYVAKTKPAHVMVSLRMVERGILVSTGSRIEYVFTTKYRNAKHVIQGEKAEDIDYFSSHSDFFKIDYLYYFEKQLIKPIDELLKVGLGIEGFMKQHYSSRLNKFLLTEEISELKRVKFICDGVKPAKLSVPKMIRETKPLEKLKTKLCTSRNKKQYFESKSEVYDHIIL
jgi:DNA polymerase elongation subunit (family B)